VTFHKFWGGGANLTIRKRDVVKRCHFFPGFSTLCHVTCSLCLIDLAR